MIRDAESGWHTQAVWCKTQVLFWIPRALQMDPDWHGLAFTLYLGSSFQLKTQFSLLLLHKAKARLGQ